MHHASPVPHASVSHRSVVDVLLELGANPDAVDAEGMTAIMEAARAAEGFEVAERLIAAKASLNLFSKAGFTPLSLAAGSGNGPVVALLLQHGAPADAIHTDGSSALMAAAENGSEPIVKALIKVSNVNAARHDGLTALMAGCGQVGVPLVKALLDAGAEPNAQDSRGVTACHMAAEVGAVDVVTLLVQAGADCTVMAHVAAITPLIVAAAAGEVSIFASADACCAGGIAVGGSSLQLDGRGSTPVGACHGRSACAGVGGVAVGKLMKLLERVAAGRGWRS